MDIRQLRKTARLSQFELSQRTGISRIRLSHAECAYLRLRPDEESAIRRTIREIAQERVVQLDQVRT